MYSLGDFFALLDGIAPIKYSRMMIEKGDYDNSGILLRFGDKVERVLFSLDLSVKAVEKARRLKCDTVITHHPAIYNPVKAIDAFGETAAVAFAAKAGLNVISMHLNLDVAAGGIDESLCFGLGGKKYRVLDSLDDCAHYGREFQVNKPLSEFLKDIKKNFGTKRTLYYGSTKSTVAVAASFCGGGAGYALDYVRAGGKADTVITSDVPHHVLKELTESGKKVIILTHYASENFGFKRFYERVKEQVSSKAEIFYFEDARFL